MSDQATRSGEGPDFKARAEQHLSVALGSCGRSFDERTRAWIWLQLAGFGAAAYTEGQASREDDQQAHEHAALEKIARMVCSREMTGEPNPRGSDCQCFSCTARKALAGEPFLDRGAVAAPPPHRASEDEKVAEVCFDHKTQAVVVRAQGTSKESQPMGDTNKSQSGSSVPRRADMGRWTLAERAIHDAVTEVEMMPADLRLSAAVTLLGEARARVADFVDGVPMYAAADQSAPNADVEPRDMTGPALIETLARGRFSMASISRRQAMQVLALKEALERQLADRHHTIYDASNKAAIGVWYWGGDDADHLESLTCPILITPEKMRDALRRARTDVLRTLASATKKVLEAHDVTWLVESIVKAMTAMARDETQVQP